MEKGPFDKIRNYLDPVPKRPESWIPANDVIVRMKQGTDTERFALKQAGIELNAQKLYRIREYQKTEDGYLLSLDEVNVQYVAGKQIVAVMNSLQDPLNINLFDPAPEHDNRTS